MAAALETSLFRRDWLGPGAVGESPGAIADLRPTRRSEPARRLAPMAPVRLEVELDLDEERDLDRDLHAELALAEEVTDHLGESAKAAAG